MRFLLLNLIISLIVMSTAQAHGPHGHANIKVLPKHMKKKLDRGMKLLSKGLGVKCKACHIKGKWDKDDRPAKVKARAFFKVVLNETDEAKKKERLKQLTMALKLECVKSPEKVWAAFELWKQAATVDESSTKR